MMVHNGLRTRNFRTCIGDIDAVLVDILIAGTWTTFGSVYVHPLAGDFGRLLQLLTANVPFFLGGDFNARNVAWGDASNNRLGLHLIDLASHDGLSLFTPTSPTCFRMSEGSYIDKYVANRLMEWSTSAVCVLPSFSDHGAIAISVFCPSLELNVRNDFRLRQYGLANVVGINRFVERGIEELRMPIDSNLANEDLEHMAHKLGEIFGEAAEKFVPTKFVRANGVVLSSTTLSLIRKNHSIQRKYWRLRSAGLRRPELMTVRSEVELVRQMMINAISFDLNEHYRLTLAESNKMSKIYKTVITNTGYRRRARCPALLFSDEAKTQSIVGEAEEFGKRFSANHNLTVNDVSSRQNEVDDCYRRLESANLSIRFGDQLTANIETNAELDAFNDGLPPSQRGILTSAEEVAEIVRRAPNKRSFGNDQMPYLLMKRFLPSILLLLTVYFN